MCVCDFSKAVSALRVEGIKVTVEDLANNIQVAKINGKNLEGGFSTNTHSLIFTEEELSVIREWLSLVSCGYERITYYHSCCDVNEIIKKIDDYLGTPKPSLR